MSKKRRTFTPDFKFQVAMECLTGQKRRVEILREYELTDRRGRGRAATVLEKQRL